jgi:hypothetical protein
LSVTPGITSETELVLREIVPIPKIESEELDAADSDTADKFVNPAPRDVLAIVPFSAPSYTELITTLYEGLDSVPTLTSEASAFELALLKSDTN